MDPKSVNNLDPKLQETYARVMGTPTPPNSASTPVTTTTTPPAATPVADSSAAQLQTPAAPPPADAGVPAYAADNLKFQAAIQTPVAAAGGATAAAAPSMVAPQVPHQTSSLLKVLYIIGAVVFFVVYTFVWIKIFNIPVPFLN